jgi:short subunit fatty acids transporter
VVSNLIPPCQALPLLAAAGLGGRDVMADAYVCLLAVSCTVVAAF